MILSLRLDYGDPFHDEAYSPYEWFQFRVGMDFFSKQPLFSEVNAIGALWGKRVWQKDNRSLAAGVFQHFDYYDSELRTNSTKEVAPYRISEAAAFGGGLIYYRAAEPSSPVDIFGELYVNGVALGASISDYMLLEERDYNLGSGYSVKAFSGLAYKKKWALLLNLENYHLFTWKGYDPDIDWSTADIASLNVQGDRSNARLTIFSTKISYQFQPRWSVVLSNRYFARHTRYTYYDNVRSSTYDVLLKLCYRL